jgi:hypothetical protein
MELAQNAGEKSDDPLDDAALRICQSPPVSRRVLVAATAVYGLICLAFLTGVPDVSFAENWFLMPVLAAIVVTVSGPAILFVGGIQLWQAFAVTMLMVVACLRFACRLWRRFPEEEWFVLPLIAAVAIWAGSGWLLAALIAI